jgi:hypothetical protein
VSVRELQEPVIRYAATLAFLGCSVAFCTTVGDVEGGTSIGLFFGLFIAAVPTAWLWGRELHEIQVRNDRRNTAAQPRRFNAEVDEPADATQANTPTSGGALRSVSYYDDEDD